MLEYGLWWVQLFGKSISTVCWRSGCLYFVFALSLPWLLGYSVMGLLPFPLESEFAAGVAQMIGKLVN